MTSPKAESAGERRFRLVVEAAPNAMVMVDPAGKIAMVNTQAERVFGYSRTELVGQPVEILVPERFRSHHPELRTAFFTDPRPRPMGAGRDLYGLKKDGSEFPVEIGLNPIETAEGTMVLSAIVDITARKTAELALRESEQRYSAGERRFRLVVEAAPNAMVMVDPAGKIVMVNTQAERVFGYSRTELVGQPVEMLVPERFRSHHPELRTAFFSDPRPRPMGAGRDLYGLKKDGSEFPVEIGLNPIETAEGTMVLSAIVDITARLRESEQRYSVLIEGVTDYAIYMVNPNGVVTNWNRGAQRIKGYRTEEIVGQHFSRFYTEEDRAANAPQQSLEMAAREGRYEAQAWRVRKDGSRFLANVVIDALRDDSGRLIGFAKITRDVTERVRAAQELEEARIDLVRSRAEEALRRVQAELAHVARVATLGELTASIAHEVNQPITASVFNARAALRWLAARPPDLEEARRAIARIVEDSLRAGDIIGRVRDLMKRAPPRADRLDINDAIQEVIQLARAEAVKNNVSVRTELADSLPFLTGDRAELQQVVLNLIINAVEAMSTVADGPREMLICSARAGLDVLVTVQDSGPGLPAEDPERIFESFYTTKQNGLGMGLSISRSIIEAHGGRLWASANAPRGAVFQFAVSADAGSAS
jgi:PAS domain S-box-containing protein